MSILRKILLLILVAALIAVIICTWGSLGSGVLIIGLCMIVPIYLFNRHVNTDREEDFSDDGTGNG